MVVAGNETRDHLVEAMGMLRDSNNPQVEFILKVIRKWAKENGIKIWARDEELNRKLMN